MQKHLQSVITNTLFEIYNVVYLLNTDITYYYSA